MLDSLYGYGPVLVRLSTPQDIDDARIYGGIHFRFDQVAGALQGLKIGRYVLTHNLRSRHVPRPRMQCEPDESFEFCLFRAVRLAARRWHSNRLELDRSTAAR